MAPLKGKLSFLSQENLVVAPCQLQSCWASWCFKMGPNEAFTPQFSLPVEKKLWLQTLALTGAFASQLWLRLPILGRVWRIFSCIYKPFFFQKIFPQTLVRAIECDVTGHYYAFSSDAQQIWPLTQQGQRYRE